MKLNLFNKIDGKVKKAVRGVLVEWKERHDLHNEQLKEIANELDKLTKTTDLSNPTQQQWETYNDLMTGFEIVCEHRRTNIEVMGIELARLHHERGFAMDQIHKAMDKIFGELKIKGGYWRGEEFNPHALVDQMVIFEREQQHIAQFIDDVSYEDACRAVGEVLADGGMTKKQAVHTCRVIRRCYEAHEKAKELAAMNREAMEALIKELLIQQAAREKEGATIH